VLFVYLKTILLHVLCRVLADWCKCSVIFSRLVWTFKFPKCIYLEKECINWSCYIRRSKRVPIFKNKSMKMHTNMWSFSCYRSVLRHIFTFILLLFQTPAFSLYKKLLLFGMCQKNLTVLDLLVKFFTIFFRLLMHLENNFSLYKFCESPASLLAKRNPFLHLQFLWLVPLCVLHVTGFHTYLWI
jgi:hypothetical protein